MKQIKVSIIIPIYKVPEKYLKKCIESCINQTLKEIEIILVDDGSPDNCGKICDEYAEKDERVKVIHKENAGVSSARNAGILMANGEYIGFVDADDWIEYDFYEEMFKYGIKTKTDIIISGFVENINNKTVEILEKEKTQVFTRNKALSKLLERKIYVWSPCDKLYKNLLVKKKISFDYRLKMGEDLDFIWNIMNISNTIGYISLNKYHYVKRSGSATLSDNPEKKWDSIRVMRKILNEMINKNVCKKDIEQMKSLYIKEMASSIIDMLKNNSKKYKKQIEFYQRNIRYILCKNLFLILKYKFKIKIGIIFSVLPYVICCKFSNLLLSDRR